jgi:hypothetical protein
MWTTTGLNTAVSPGASHDRNSSRGPTKSRGPESAHDGESNRPVALRLNSRKRVCHRTYFSGTSAHHCFSGCRSLATGNYSMSRSVLRTAFRRRPTRKLDTSYRISMRRRPQPECVLTILHLRLPGRFELPSSRTKRPGPITPAKTSNHWTVNHWTLLRQADRVPRAAPRPHGSLRRACQRARRCPGANGLRPRD